MNEATEVHAGAKQRGWLVYGFRQELMPPQIVFSTLANGMQDRDSKICSGLSFLWCHGRLVGPMIDFQGRMRDSQLAREAALLQQAAADQNPRTMADMEQAGFDRRAVLAGLACYPNDWKHSTHSLPTKPILDMCTGSSSPGRRVCFVSFLGRERDNPKELNSLNCNWAHAIAFEANGPGLTLFDPNFGEFRASGAARPEMLDFIYGKTAYTYVQMKHIFIYRMRPIA